MLSQSHTHTNSVALTDQHSVSLSLLFPLALPLLLLPTLSPTALPPFWQPFKQDFPLCLCVSLSLLPSLLAPTPMLALTLTPAARHSFTFAFRCVVVVVGNRWKSFSCKSHASHEAQKKLFEFFEFLIKNCRKMSDRRRVRIACN